ncbi:MAG: lyase family protein [Actinomycetota bacterium]|nr:lyase family protein [Actinomycetota bacterium]
MYTTDNFAEDGADYGLLSPAWAGTEVAALTGDRAFVQALLDVEWTWIKVLAEAGYVDGSHVMAVAAAASADQYDIASVAVRAQGGGNPLIPLLADLRQSVAGTHPEAAAAIHRGATSQDIVDTALMLLARRSIAVIGADLRSAAAALADLAERHRQTLCVARTLTQHSLPSTFGLKAAQWLAGVGQAGVRLEEVASGLPLQWGGAAGTMAAVTQLAGSDGPGAGEHDAGALPLAADLASRLGLADPVAPWQTNRLPVTGLGQALADVLAAAGKIANDVLLLSRPEVGEVSEPAVPGRGVSSAMPQKQNPVLSVLIRSAALAAPGYQVQLQTAAGAAVDERPDGSWHVEWQALRQLLRLAGGGAAKLAELAAGLTVHPERMRAALELTGPLLVSEKIMAVIAPLLDGETSGSGKKRVQALVEQSRRTSAGRGEPLAVLLRDAVSRDALSDTELAALLDPASYIGASEQLITRIVSTYQDWSAA